MISFNFFLICCRATKKSIKNPYCFYAVTLTFNREILYNQPENVPPFLGHHNEHNHLPYGNFDIVADRPETDFYKELRADCVPYIARFLIQYLVTTVMNVSC